jgi:hypothetical protein
MSLYFISVSSPKVVKFMDARWRSVSNYARDLNWICLKKNWFGSLLFHLHISCFPNILSSTNTVICIILGTRFSSSKTDHRATVALVFLFSTRMTIQFTPHILPWRPPSKFMWLWMYSRRCHLSLSHLHMWVQDQLSSQHPLFRKLR